MNAKIFHKYANVQVGKVDVETFLKGDDNEVLMSHWEFIEGGKNVKGVPVTITPDGKEPVFVDEKDFAFIAV